MTRREDTALSSGNGTPKSVSKDKGKGRAVEAVGGGGTVSKGYRRGRGRKARRKIVNDFLNSRLIKEFRRARVDPDWETIGGAFRRLFKCQDVMFDPKLSKQDLVDLRVDVSLSWEASAPEEVEAADHFRDEVKEARLDFLRERERCWDEDPSEYRDVYERYGGIAGGGKYCAEFAEMFDLGSIQFLSDWIDHVRATTTLAERSPFDLCLEGASWTAPESSDSLCLLCEKPGETWADHGVGICWDSSQS